MNRRIQVQRNPCYKNFHGKGMDALLLNICYVSLYKTESKAAFEIYYMKNAFSKGFFYDSALRFCLV